MCFWCSFVLFVAEKGGRGSPRGSGVSLLLFTSSFAGSLRKPLDEVPITGAAFLCCTPHMAARHTCPGGRKDQLVWLGTPRWAQVPWWTLWLLLVFLRSTDQRLWIRMTACDPSLVSHTRPGSARTRDVPSTCDSGGHRTLKCCSAFLFLPGASLGARRSLLVSPPAQANITRSSCPSSAPRPPRYPDAAEREALSVLFCVRPSWCSP